MSGPEVAGASSCALTATTLKQRIQSGLDQLHPLVRRPLRSVSSDLVDSRKANPYTAVW